MVFGLISGNLSGLNWYSIGIRLGIVMLYLCAPNLNVCSMLSMGIVMGLVHMVWYMDWALVFYMVKYVIIMGLALYTIVW